MRFFRRDTGTDDSPIEAFWAWWPTVSDQIASSIEDGSVERWVSPVSERVDAIDRNLAWELGPGATAKHAFVVSPEGNPVARPIALTWLAGAPQADQMWEFHASRQAGALGILRTDEIDVDLNDVRSIASWNKDRHRVDVKLWHPALEKATDSTRDRIGFLFLLGEDTVERWIGEIDVLNTAISGRTPEELRAEVDRQAAEAGTQSWILATRTDKRGEGAIVIANTAIKPIDYPFHQDHLVVSVGVGSEQLAGDGATSEALNRAEDLLLDAMADSTAVYLGRVTERRRRLIHFVAQSGSAAKAAAEEWSKAHRPLRPDVQVRHDPEWRFRGQLGVRLREDAWVRT